MKVFSLTVQQPVNEHTQHVLGSPAGAMIFIVQFCQFYLSLVFAREPRYKYM